MVFFAYHWHFIPIASVMMSTLGSGKSDLPPASLQHIPKLFNLSYLTKSYIPSRLAKSQLGRLFFIITIIYFKIL